MTVSVSSCTDYSDNSSLPFFHHNDLAGLNPPELALELNLAVIQAVFLVIFWKLAALDFTVPDEERCAAVNSSSVPNQSSLVCRL